MFDWLRRKPKRKSTNARPRSVRASYDAASLSDQALSDFQGADGFSADAAAAPNIRDVIRRRGRHEMLNNPYLDGIVQTFANDIVGGSGPRLRMRTGVRSLNNQIEHAVTAWMKAIRLASKMRLMVETDTAQGEVFAQLYQNRKSPNAIKLDLYCYEPDQVATPGIWPTDDVDRIDGIEFDNAGNPAFYHLLNTHPGDNRWYPGGMFEYVRIPASEMIHLFKARRPGQRRGLPRIMSALTLFPQRRSFRQSVLIAARAAAQLGAVLLESESDPNVQDEEGEDYAGTSIDLEHGLMTALPRGLQAKQMAAEQPATTYAEFNNSIIAESARGLSMPRNIAMCDSSDYNYASGRLDHQTYDRNIGVYQRELEDIILDRLLARWFDEALRIPGYLPARTEAVLRRSPPHLWMWKKRPHVDVAKEANAQETRLRSGVTTLSMELADEAIDFEDHAEELLREIEWYRQHGLTHPAEAKSSGTAEVAEPQDDRAEQADDEQKPNTQTSATLRNGHSRMGSIV